MPSTADAVAGDAPGKQSEAGRSTDHAVRRSQAREGLAADAGDGEPTPEPTLVLGYTCADPALKGFPNREFQRQAEEISAECARRGLSLVQIVHEREPRRGGALQRPALA